MRERAGDLPLEIQEAVLAMTERIGSLLHFRSSGTIPILFSKDLQLTDFVESRVNVNHAVCCGRTRSERMKSLRN
jgi:hypothetical protein